MVDRTKFRLGHLEPSPERNSILYVHTYLHTGGKGANEKEEPSSSINNRTGYV